MQTIKDFLDKMNISESERKSDILYGYMNGILKANETVNITTIKEPEDFVIKHYADSLACTSSMEFKRAESVIDIGTGGGFPGVPLAVCYPEKEFTLVDSTGKRIDIIRKLCSDLDISNISAIHGRAEELAGNSDLREKFDLCVSRAVAPLNVLCEYCLPFVKKGGCFAAYKGPGCEEELEKAGRAMFLLGGKVNRIEDCNLTGLDHVIAYIDKKDHTPDTYPRKPGTPSKKPL